MDDRARIKIYTSPTTYIRAMKFLLKCLQLDTKVHLLQHCDALVKALINICTDYFIAIFEFICLQLEQIDTLISERGERKKQWLQRIFSKEKNMKDRILLSSFLFSSFSTLPVLFLLSFPPIHSSRPVPPRCAHSYECNMSISDSFFLLV